MAYKFFKKGNFYMHCYTFGEFAAHAENVLVDPNLKHKETSILEEYSVSDPMALKTGSVGKENSVSKWPSIFYNDIATYLKILGLDFIKNLDWEYKLEPAVIL